jgi:two-component system, cell cycle sensor histidine kinase and response regulator CckA
MNKKEYINKELSRLTWASLLVFFPYGSFFILLMSILDYFVTPENYSKFLFYRVVAASIGISAYLVLKKIKNKHGVIQLAAIVVAILIPSIMVESMIVSFGGHSSPYYAGMIVVIIFALGFLPISVRLTAASLCLIYSIYIFPILLLDNITDVKVFINNNMFLMASALGALGWRYFYQRLIVRNLSLEYDLSQDKKQLEVYSSQLEELVQERTKELAISEKWHKSIFDNATDGIIVQDKKGSIMNVNKKACEIHGFKRDALIGVNIELLETRGDKKLIDERREQILNGESIIYETEHYKKDGEKVVLEVSSKAIEIGEETYIQSFYRDITEKKRIQEQLMHSQKMESVGALAGGIAHNFNNILTTILGYSELLLEFSELDETSKLRVRNIESSARKAGIMVSKLLSFARRETHEIVPLNLHDVINDSVRLFEGVLDKRIGIKMELNSMLQNIEGDPNQIEQVIMNLMVNARDAMPDGGLITVSTKAMEVGKERSNTPLYIVPGNYTILTIADTGTGIPKEIMNRIFDPFFTTKEKGKGTGLGLATVYGIVKDHKGYISVESEKGKGSAFSIYFPVPEKITLQREKPKIISMHGYENILLVDDDIDVLNFVREILEGHGYSVLPVSNSLNAIDIFRSHSETIQIVVTDIMMPLMEGNELIKNLKRIKPDIKIIVISGYSDAAVSKDKLVDAFIKKPFESMELLSAVRRLLDTGIRKLPLY